MLEDQALERSLLARIASLEAQVQQQERRLQEIETSDGPDHPPSELDINLPELKQAVEGIIGMFIWEDSEEGEEYWSEVYRKLSDYMDQYNKQQ